MNEYPPPPPWTSGFRAQRAAMQKAAMQQDGDEATPHKSRESRGDKLEWLILSMLLAVVVVVLVLK